MERLRTTATLSLWDLNNYMKERLQNDFKRWRTEIAAASIVVLAMELLFHGVCLSKLIFGLPCPGCGMTRAAFLFLTGDFAGSFRMHPLFMFLLPGLSLLGYERYYKGRKAKITSWYFAAYFVVLLIVFVLRMKLYFPQEEPMTYYQGALFPLSGN